MAFVVDGAEWRFDGWLASDIAGAIETLLERVWTARDRNETVWIGDDLQTQAVLGKFSLWELSSPDAPISLTAELWQELAAWLGAASRYCDEAEWPDGATETLIRVGSNVAEENADLAWAHHHVRGGHPVACLGLTRKGPYKTVSNLGSATVHWVQDEATHRAFWRSAIDVEGDNELTLRRLASHAFPDLYFYDHVWDGLRRLAGGYHAMRILIRRYLAVLDDDGFWAFTFPPPSLHPGEGPGPDTEASPPNQLIERRFRRLGLDIAPENPNVYADGTCRRAREISIGMRTLYCEWHGKLEPYQNRLHIHPPVPESSDKVIVAIIHDHLPLPGDS